MSPDLATILSDSLTRLERGAADPGHPCRNLALGTAGQGGMPQVRSVVLRRFHPSARALDVHTDARSAKHAELLANPQATLHSWDDAARIQLRMAGLVTLHHRDSAAAESWAALKPRSQATYRVQPGPGTIVDSPRARQPDAEDDAAYNVFCVLRLRFDTLDYLHLEQSSHRRARFVWAGTALTAMWLVP